MNDRLDWSSSELYTHSQLQLTAALQTSFQFTSKLFPPYLRYTPKASPSSPAGANKVVTYRYSFIVICHIYKILCLS